MNITRKNVLSFFVVLSIAFGLLVGYEMITEWNSEASLFQNIRRFSVCIIPIVTMIASYRQERKKQLN